MYAFDAYRFLVIFGASIYICIYFSVNALKWQRVLGMKRPNGLIIF